MTKLRAACVQMRSTTNPDENVEVFSELVGQAVRGGASYIQSPEMTGLVVQDRGRLFDLVKTADEDLLIACAKSLAKEHNIWLHVGSTAILRADGKVANRAFVIDPGGLIRATYDKIHMFDVDLDNGESWRESAVYKPGKSAVIADIAGARTGLAICYDMRFPQLFQDYAQAGAEILTSPAAFTRQTGKAHWHILLRSRAIENGAFMIAAAQGGDHQDGRETFGHSLIVNPWGEIIAEIGHDEPGVVVAEIDLDEVRQARAKIPNLVNGRAYTLEIPGGRTGKDAA
ncbi:MAG: carbon-nitrogen hydrolase family protein [Rhodobacteraceae bacterium]|nr:carbon-nitrogen hydrolase family protein [Paracoccaceae bacterium]